MASLTSPPKLKLGEALSLRARQAQLLEDLRERIKVNALAQEDTPPAEDPEKLIEEFERVSDEHAVLVQRIARTNAAGVASNGDNMLSLLHQREALRRKRNIHDAAARAATVNSNAYRFGRSEIKFVAHVEVTKHRGIADELDEAIRRIDAIIQESNWQLELA